MIVRPLFAARLRSAREAANLRRESVATQLGCSYASIAGYELGHRLPPLDIVADLADLYGVTLNDLLPGEARRVVC